VRSSTVFTAVDTHTEGMPTRVITAGLGTLPGTTMAERSRHVATELDHVRRLLMYEPRGHDAMSGAIIQPPIQAGADLGVVFIEVTGCLPMCGHGTIGVATVAVETGLVAVEEPVTTIKLDTPAGLVEARVDVADGRAHSVTIRNVPSFVAVEAATIEVAGIGPMTVDVAFGGNFYVIVPADAVGCTLDPASAGDLIRHGLAILEAVEDEVELAHPLDPAIRGSHHVLFTAPGDDDVTGHGAVVIHPGYLDRSPCGTGTSARMALHHHRGELALDVPFVHTSIIGSRFTGRLVEETSVADRPAVVPTITGRAWVTALAHYLLDPTDPFPAGFRVGR
jgi:proline racemase